jgi:hypothetical protein
VVIRRLNITSGVHILMIMFSGSDERGRLQL